MILSTILKTKNILKGAVLFGFVFIFFPLVASATIPNDPLYPNQSHLPLIKAPDAWDKVTGNGVVIAIVDAGFDSDHPDLAGNMWVNEDEIPSDLIDNDNNGFVDDIHGWDFIVDDPEIHPKINGAIPTNLDNFPGVHHGTVVGGLAAAIGNNGMGVSGVAWRAKIMGLRALNSSGIGDLADIARAIDYATENKADVINLSLVGPERSPLVEDAINRAYEAGITIVAASGNSDINNGVNLDSSRRYPVCQDGTDGINRIIGVGALDNTFRRASFSNYGSMCVDISAPGEELFSTVNHSEAFNLNDFYLGGFTGTSMSAPLVSGAAALLKSINRNFTPADIHDILTTTADDLDSINPTLKGKLGGSLNVSSAVDEAIRRSPATASRITKPSNILAAHLAKESEIRIFNQFGALVSLFPIAKESSVATGDIDGDGLADVVVGARAENDPKVYVYSSVGELKQSFLAYDQSFRGGVEVAVGDLDGDGVAEIITGPGAGGGPHIKVFDGLGIFQNQFFAFDRDHRAGVKLTTANTGGDTTDEIVVLSLQPEVGARVFDQRGSLFFSLTTSNAGSISAGDINGSGFDEIITATKRGFSPNVDIFKNGIKVDSFLAYDESFRDGFSVAAGDLNGDTLSEIITGPSQGSSPHTRTFTQNGLERAGFFSYNPNSRFGIAVAEIADSSQF